MVLDSAYDEARQVRAAILLKLGRVAEAEKDYRAVVAESPQSADAWEGLGNFLRATPAP